MTSRIAYLFYGIVLALGALAGCTPSIGDKCVLSTDCSIRGDRLCDTSQIGGYCTVFNCNTNSCPDEAVCVLFHGSVQGCGYDDRAVSRTARTFCMAKCTTNSDCRDGYECAKPTLPPWQGIVLDDDQSKAVCIVTPTAVTGSDTSHEDPDAAVCKASVPLPPDYVDSGVSPSDAGDAGVTDAGVSDAGVSDAGTSDAGDASHD